MDGCQVSRHRVDIQALRGLAVLLVVLYHYELAPIPAGYLGVDIFFVISGYLITGLITRPGFSFGEFYWRRAMRLLPAALAVLAVTAALAPVLLVDSQMQAFGQSLFGALTFSANIVLWTQTSYFDESSMFKPLLHMWSLAIEEQFYFVLPAALLFLPRHWWKAGLIIACLCSLALCLILVGLKPTPTFYLLPTRAWELLVGSIGATALNQARIPAALYWPALATLFVLPVFPIAGAHPSIDAILICSATLIIILARRPTLAGTGLSHVGDISYSLYLVHWPIAAFMANVWLGDVPLSWRLAGALLSLLTAVAMYRWIEQPCRVLGAQHWRLLLVPGAVLPALLITSMAMTRIESPFAEIMRPNYGLSRTCEFPDSPNLPYAGCAESEAPEIMVWGDSFAMQLVAGLAAHTDASLVQVTRTTCGPFLDLAPVARKRTSHQNRTWALDCLEFNALAVAYLRATPSIRTVVLSAALNHYVANDEYRLISADGTLREGSVALIEAALKGTIAAIEAQGRRVVLISQMPAPGTDIGKCLERAAEEAPRFADCRIDEQVYAAKWREVNALLDEIPDAVRLDRLLCEQGECLVRAGDIPLYRDDGHLTYDASHWLMGQLRKRGDLSELGLRTGLKIN